MSFNDGSNHPLANPDHPSHSAFNWGRFFAILTTALVIAAPEVEILVHSPKIDAAITGAETMLGSLAQAMVPAETAPQAPSAPIADPAPAVKPQQAPPTLSEVVARNEIFGHAA